MIPRPQILIVDDKPQNLTLLQGMLRGMEAAVIPASDGATALALAEETPFAAAILDVQMPELDGYQLARALRAQERNAALPIIFLTAVYVDQEGALKGYESGAVDFITKPVPAVVLRSKVSVFLELHRKQRELEAKANETARVYQDLATAHEALKQSQAETIHAARLATLGEMASTLAHELRSPLSALVSALDLLREDLETSRDEQRPPPASAFTFLDTMSKAVARCEAVSANVLHFSQKAPFLPERVELATVLSESLQLMRGTLAKQKTTVEVAVDDQLFVSGDRQRLQQVITNLVLNASQATAPGDTVWIRARRDGDSARIDVVDNGGGIPPDQLQRIFEPFYTTKGGRGGTGLGLSVCRKIVSEHGGTIHVHCKPGEETTFTLILPGAA